MQFERSQTIYFAGQEEGKWVYMGAHKEIWVRSMYRMKNLFHICSTHVKESRHCTQCFDGQKHDLPQNMWTLSVEWSLLHQVASQIRTIVLKNCKERKVYKVTVFVGIFTAVVPGLYSFSSYATGFNDGPLIIKQNGNQLCRHWYVVSFFLMH